MAQDSEFMTRVGRNIVSDFSPAERVVIDSELRAAELLEDAQRQVLRIAESLGIMDTVTGEYVAADTPDLARTIRLARSMGVTVRIIVVHPEVDI